MKNTRFLDNIIGFNVAEMPLETVQEILKNKWSGKHYFERIWHNMDVLADKLEEVITRGLMTGKSSMLRMQKQELIFHHFIHTVEVQQDHTLIIWNHYKEGQEIQRQERTIS